MKARKKPKPDHWFTKQSEKALQRLQEEAGSRRVVWLPVDDPCPACGANEWTRAGATWTCTRCGSSSGGTALSFVDPHLN